MYLVYLLRTPRFSFAVVKSQRLGTEVPPGTAELCKKARLWFRLVCKLNLALTQTKIGLSLQIRRGECGLLDER